MFCPRCGQQQATDSMRFCSRCGFALEGVAHVLAHGGMLPQYQSPLGEKTTSPRRRGVRQGGLLMLIGVLLVPLMGVFSAFAPGRFSDLFGFFAAISAILCFVGGPLRMLYAAIFEEGAPARQLTASVTYTPPPIPAQGARVTALPPAAANPTAAWRPRPQTAEIVQPPSVTDNTTRLLEKLEPKTD